MLPNHDLLELAATAADRAARYIRSVPRPRDPDGWQRKGFSDFVTEVDREAERLVTETLLSGAPESVIQGEELSPDQDQSADLLWIVDPLDGTTNYLHGYPAYAVSIAAMTGDGSPPASWSTSRTALRTGPPLAGVPGATGIALQSLVSQIPPTR